MQTTTEQITWHWLPAMPDADITVLLKITPTRRDDDNVDVWPGYWDGDNWCLADGMRVGHGR